MSVTRHRSCQGQVAVSILDTLKPNELVIVKAMKNPPAGVKLVMEAVCIMLEKAPERRIDLASQKPILDYWPTSVRLLADMDFRKVVAKNFLSLRLNALLWFFEIEPSKLR